MQKNNMQENNLQQITCRIPSEGDLLKESACEDKQQSGSKPNTLWARSGPVRISVAYGNIPAPGLGKFERASQGLLRIVCGCLAESVAMQIKMMKFEKIEDQKRENEAKKEQK